MSVTARKQHHRRGIGLANEWAESALDKGDLSSALEYYESNEHLLRERPEQGPQDPEEAAEALRETQFGKVKALLMLGRLAEARRSAREALVSGFADNQASPDSRRYTLTVLANAKTRPNFAKAWVSIVTIPGPE